jgi:hypothetical protein
MSRSKKKGRGAAQRAIYLPTLLPCGPRDEERRLLKRRRARSEDIRENWPLRHLGYPPTNPNQPIILPVCPAASSTPPPPADLLMGGLLGVGGA